MNETSNLSQTLLGQSRSYRLGDPESVLDILPPQFWEFLCSLSSTLQEKDLETSLRQVLKPGSDLSGARVMAIYRAQNRVPEVQLVASIGETQLLPEQLYVQDLVHLNKPQQWVSGTRPTCTIHRMARIARLSRVASAPIGPPNAMVGLVVAADDRVNSHGLLLPITQLIAVTVTSIFQQEAWMGNLQSELKAQASQIRAKATLEAQAQEGFVSLDAHLQIKRMNMAAEKILGYTSREVSNQPVEKLLIGSEALLHALVAAQGGCSTYNLDSVRLYRRNGDTFLSLVRIFPVMNGDQVDEIIVFIDDLSEQEQIRSQAEQLEERALLGEVTAVFAHEVRNLVNNISTGVQFMAMNLPKDNPNREAVSRMLQDCDRLAELMKSVLSYSRPIDYEMENLDLPSILKRLLERLRTRITKFKVQYDLKVEPNCPLIQGNLRALEQVFNNLISNALQAMGEHGGSLVLKVRPISTPSGRAYVEVSVADTGSGIPKELQERVFQPFFTTERNGTGLGLPIAKRIITAHKGNISLESFPGGTIFYVQLPAVAA